MHYRELLHPVRCLMQGYRSWRCDVEDVKALALLPALGVPYLPWSSSALRPSAVGLLLNEIVINRRSAVIECGSGISTLMMAKLLADTGGRIWSIDHNAEWLAIVRGLLERMGIPEGVVQLIHAPLEVSAISIENEPWYSADAVRAQVRDCRFDLLVVDGPEAWQRPRCLARYAALPFFHEQLKDDYCVVLDDIHRRGERAITRLWAERFNLNAVHLAARGDVAVLRPRGGKSFTIQ